MRDSMWPVRIRGYSQGIWALLIVVYLFSFVQGITIRVPERSITEPVQGSVLFSVDIACTGIPTIGWTFTSESEQRNVVSWKHGGIVNISEFYQERVHTFSNGSFILSDVKLQDTGYYIISVTEPSGNSRDAGLVLHVTEVIYEDVQYLAVSALALGAVAGTLMLSMWLLNKLYHYVISLRKRGRIPEHSHTELQILREHPARSGDN
ncbi:V-set and transmembrane domain-containing protein 5 [Chanos chanos]|uniref:V-set and transmembrane domain-containing protein 5 n=1 Tax=Chanos chanos TaxID=29144 RepID=A0A6J2VS82_CHACN|nr:V-set and transmembrane domain-containing protein 5 [Chanos chanos]